MQIDSTTTFFGEIMMDWLPVFILLTILVVTFIPTPKAEETNDSMPC
jgi:hypothetical protein